MREEESKRLGRNARDTISDAGGGVLRCGGTRGASGARASIHAARSASDARGARNGRARGGAINSPHAVRTMVEK